MKKALLIFILGASISVIAQKNQTLKLDYPDSVQIVLENTKNVDAITVGAAFAGVWNNIGYDLQAVIKQQAKKIRKKGYRLRPEITNYYGAIADAINLEGADPSKLQTFFKVTDQVIELESRDKANEFFVAAREFFEHHSLHWNKSYQLLSKDDDFEFDYITVQTFDPYAVPESTMDTISAWLPDPLPEPTYDPYDTTYVEPPSAPSFVPYITPPPEITGPVLRFKRLSMVFSTNYDSAILSETKGVYSLRDRIFVGEGGRFDWTSVGLPEDSVYFNFTSQYFFKVTKPEFKIEQGEMTYVGRTPGAVAGVLEFKSVPHRSQADALWPKFTSFENNISTSGLANPDLTFTGGFSLSGRKVSSASLNLGMSTLELNGETGKRFIVKSHSFDLQDSLISAKQSSLMIFHDNDTLSRPAVDFRYDISRNSVLLTKTKSSLKDAPYSSTYFDVDFSSDVMRWDLEADSLDFYTAGSVSQSPMVIESVDHYNLDDFLLLTGVGFSFHPLRLLAAYVQRYGVSTFNVGDVVQAYKKDYNEVRRAMDFLAQKGMIMYDPLTGST